MAAYVAVFVTVAAVVAGAIVWQTNELLIRQVFATLSAEAEGLRQLARQRGNQLVVEAIAERSRTAGPGLYFLTDRRGRKLAGNLNRWPPELRDGSGGLFRYRAAAGDDARERVAIGVPVNLYG